MKRSKKLTILAAVLAAVCLITVLVLGMEQKKEEIRTSDKIILEIPADTVTALSWEGENEPLSFHKEESWIYDGDAAFPVDGEKIARMLEPFARFGAAFIIENVEDYAQYGLDEPEEIIRLTAGDTDYEIRLGDFSAMDEQRYVSIGDGSVYLVEHDPMDEFDAVLSDLLLRDELPDFDKAQKVTFSGDEAYTITYQEEGGPSHREDDTWYAGDKPLDPFHVDSYLDHITHLDLGNHVTYNATPEELASYGLDQPQLTIAVDYLRTDEDETETPASFVLSVSRDPEEQKAAEEKAAQQTGETDEESEDPITAYVRVGESPIVYKITRVEYEDLMAAGFDDLRHEEVLPADFADVVGLSIRLEDTTYDLTTEGGEDDRTWMFGEREISISELQRTLSALRAREYTDQQPTDKLEVALTVTLADTSTVKIELYRLDGDDCLALVDGEPLALVSRSSVVEMIETIHAIILAPTAEA